MFDQEIQAGTKLLGEKVGGDWWKRVDVDQLDMFTCDRCVLGQIFGDYFDGLVVLEGVKYQFETSPCFAMKNGFSLGDYNAVSFGILTKEWSALILARQKGEA